MLERLLSALCRCDFETIKDICKDCVDTFSEQRTYPTHEHRKVTPKTPTNVYTVPDAPRNRRIEDTWVSVDTPSTY